MGGADLSVTGGSIKMLSHGLWLDRWESGFAIIQDELENQKGLDYHANREYKRASAFPISIS
jgi:hypothetical protein